MYMAGRAARIDYPVERAECPARATRQGAQRNPGTADAMNKQEVPAKPPLRSSQRIVK
jgi:hypothetical protein